MFQKYKSFFDVSLSQIGNKKMIYKKTCMINVQMKCR